MDCERFHALTVVTINMIVCRKFTDASEELDASIFRAEEKLVDIEYHLCYTLDALFYTEAESNS
jgi:hypothetical protein